MSSNSARPTQYYELYRRSSIGMQLTDALDELIQSGHINPVLAMKVLTQFDKSVADTLNKKVKSKSSLKGHLHTYRSCDEVWTFFVKDGNMKLDNGEMLHIDSARIVACKLGEGASASK
ncbi:transcription initiation factor IIA, gamma subunit [Ceraceosorus guamensis]|uniref:Transcription initiation factor IIA subunit 2 n=1 Tax=Ceraceosorus guamensis TaxID=1522189 RepID=A0A316W679_9BASI|nr:transcription initiation factor IIA, gamma subunit [Ceraceosorus guamensis]PWN45389.1 transcription initiation factor IIA, gamma subunit [Ceraceosorus guamensis]